MAQSRTFNSVRNIIWAVIYKIIVILLPFVVRSVMIYKLGVEYTGLSSLFTSILTMLSLAELGFSNAMVYCMYEPIHNDDKNTICALLKLYKKIYSIIGSIILTIGLVLIPFLPRLIHDDVPGGISIYGLYLIYLFNTVISYFMFAYKSSLLTAYQRNDLISIIGMISHIGMNGIQIAVLLLTGNFYLYAVILPISTVAMNLSYELLTRKFYPDITCRGEVSSELKGKIKKRVVGIMLYKFSSSTRTSFDSVIISMFLGLAILTQYQNYFTIISAVLGILSIITTSVTASVGDSIVAKDIDSNYSDFKKFVFIYMWVAGWFAICIGCLIQPFMRIWMGEELLLVGTMALLFSAYFYSQTMGDIVFLYRTAAGLWWQDRIRPVVEAVANISLNVVMVKLFGLHGVILATVITLVFINFVWGAHILFKHYFARSMKEYVFMQMRQAAVVIIAGIVTWLLCNMLPQGIVMLIVRMAICAVVPNIVFLLFYHRTHAFKQAYQFGLSTIWVFTGKLHK